MEIKGAPWPLRENDASGVVLHRTTVLTVSQRVASRADRSPADEGRELSSGLAVAGGSVVNVSSVSGLIGAHDGAADNASQGAVRQLTRAAALDGARQPRRIRINAVHALLVDGPIVDGMTGTLCEPAMVREQLAADLPFLRHGRPEEIAACVLYLLSDESAFVTGASYVLDGGFTAGR